MNLQNFEGDKETFPRFIVWQALIWDRFAKVSPILTIILTGLFYVLGFRNWVLFFDVVGSLGALVVVTWWFWVIYTIASIAYMIDRSSTKLKDVIEEIREIKKEVIDIEKSLIEK